MRKLLTCALGLFILVLGSELWRSGAIADFVYTHDSGGRLMSVGAIASGSAVTGNPVLVAGRDDSGNARSLHNDGNGDLYVRPSTSSGAFGDPCMDPTQAKSSAVISITSATTTSLVAVSGSTAVFICGGSLTISEVVTTPNTFQLEFGTGASCTGTTALTGTYGAGGVTAGDPIVVVIPELKSTGASQGVCAVTTIGGSGSFQGVLYFVQR